MATAIQIEVLVDDKGVVQGVNRVVDSIKRVHGAGGQAFDKVNESENKARESALLLEEATGVRIPRALNKVIASAPGVSAALGAAFEVTAVIAFGAAVVEAVNHMDSFSAKSIQTARDIRAGFSHIFDHPLDHMLAQMDSSITAQMDKDLSGLQDQLIKVNEAANTAGKTGFAALQAGLKNTNIEIDQLAKKSFQDITSRLPAGEMGDEERRRVLDRTGMMRSAAEAKTNADIQALRLQHEAALVDIEVKGELAGKSEIEKLRLQLAADLHKIDIAGGTDPSAQGAAARAAQKKAVIATEAAQENDIQHQALVAGIHTRLEAEANAAKGEEQIRAEKIAKLNAITEQERQKGFQLQDDRVAAETEADAKIAVLRRAASDQIFDAEQKAAVASVPQWEQSNAQIVADFQKRQREIDQELKDTVINSAEADQLRAANWRETNARMAQDYATQFENLYNDITTGGIGKAIEAQMRKFFFNILGQWAAALQQQRQQTASGGGFFGALLGSLFGNGGGGGATAGTGPYGLPAGVANNFGGDEFGGLTAADFGYSPIGGSRTDPYALGGGGSLNTASLGATLGGTALGTVLHTSVGGASSGIPGGPGAAAGGILSAASLSKLAPLALLGSLMLGSKGGASAIAAGGLIGGLGIAALSSNNPAIFGAALPYASLLGPLAGGLVGFGVGQVTGSKTYGALSGAGTGALVGLYAAGPIGALIGGIIGGLAGLFGGLFGGHPSKHSLADKFINAQVLPMIQQQITAYEGFQTDFASSINSLEQLKQQSYDQMKQSFGTDATNDEWNKLIVPAISSAEDRIRLDEAERQRRATLQFGAPQFAEGGIFGGGSLPGGAGIAVLHPMERVMTSRATSMYGNELAMMEASAKAGTALRGGDIHLHFSINAIDKNSVRNWLRNEGGGHEIASHFRGRLNEGHSGF